MPNGGKGPNDSHTSFILACISCTQQEYCSIFIFEVGALTKSITKVTVSFVHSSEIFNPNIYIFLKRF